MCFITAPDKHLKCTNGINFQLEIINCIHSIKKSNRLSVSLHDSTTMALSFP